MLHLTESEVRRLLPMTMALELVEAGFRHLAAGQAANHPRRRLQQNSSATLHYMTAVDLATGYIAAKLYTTHPQTGAHFIVLLWAADGTPLASIEANALGQIRTGAATGVATRFLARPDARIAGVIGTGFQARTQLEAVACVRKLAEVRVFSRLEERRCKFAAEMSELLAIPVLSAASAEEAVQGTDIIITATNSRDPVLLGKWLPPGVHVNAVGSNQARRRELDSGAVGRAVPIVTDSLEQARMESGDLIAAVEAGAASWDHVVELSEVVAHNHPGRSRPEDITLFKSNGLALEDAAVAGYVYEQGRE